jgi:adenylate cyclase, class 2
MKYEVEQKHRIEFTEAELTARLSPFGGRFGEPIEQVDQYFAHPCRDFSRTDEALRIRTVGSESFLTYKGARLESTAKMRPEIELPIGSANSGAAQFAELLGSLGFTPVVEVRKIRRPFHVHLAGEQIEGAFDRVGELGEFVELELIADKASLETAENVIAELAGKLGLGEIERRSYLEMLITVRSARGN